MCIFVRMDSFAVVICAQGQCNQIALLGLIFLVYFFENKFARFFFLWLLYFLKENFRFNYYIL